MVTTGANFSAPLLAVFGLCFHSFSPCPYLHRELEKEGKRQILKQNFGNEISSSCFSKRKQLCSYEVNDKDWIALLS